MKKIRPRQVSVIRFVLISFLLPSLSAKADWLTFEGEEKPWSISIGTRVWVNQWETPQLRYSSAGLPAGLTGAKDAVVTQGTTKKEVLSQDFEPTPIPYTTMRYGRFFISGSYYSTTDFAFNHSVETIDIYSANSGYVDNVGHAVTRTSGKGSREEWDISLGYSLLKSLALTVGYKKIDMNITGTTSYDADPAYANTNDSNNTIQGPVVGLNASLPLAYGIGAYGSYAYGFMEWDYKNNTHIKYEGEVVASKKESRNNVDTDYHIAEVGLTYTPDLTTYLSSSPITAATIFAGYRFQRIIYNFSESGVDSTASDTTQGFVSGVNLSF